MAKDKQLAQNLNEDRMRMRLSDLERTLIKCDKAEAPNALKRSTPKANGPRGNGWTGCSTPAQSGWRLAHSRTRMYENEGGCPAEVVIELGRIHGQPCLVVANDATVKAGAWFPITGKKNLRAQGLPSSRLPIIYLVDGAGIVLANAGRDFPRQRAFRPNVPKQRAPLVSWNPQIAAVMGGCVAGGAYTPIMSDESIIVEGSGSIFLAGSYLVKAAIGETIDNETLGGAATHDEISGIALPLQG